MLNGLGKTSSSLQGIYRIQFVLYETMAVYGENLYTPMNSFLLTVDRFIDWLISITGESNHDLWLMFQFKH